MHSYVQLWAGFFLGHSFRPAPSSTTAQPTCSAPATNAMPQRSGSFLTCIPTTAAVSLHRLARALKPCMARASVPAYLQVQDAAEVGAGAGRQQRPEILDQRVGPAADHLHKRQKWSEYSPLAARE